MSESFRNLTDVIETEFIKVKFQTGPVGEHGRNGCFIEDILEIARQRLREHQETEFKCRENSLALTKIEEALHWLVHRTTLRTAQGIEGKDIPHQS